MSRTDFIKEIAPFAVSSMAAKKILASLTIAQACLESSDGESELAAKYFNLFGIKGTGPAGTIALPTEEWDGSKMVTVTANFRVYSSWEESVADHATLLAGMDRYANLVGETDAARAAYLIQKDGYATDPGYTTKLTAIIQENGLAAYDKPDPCPEWARGSRDLLVAHSITDGTRPNDPVTRAEVWTMLNRLWYVLEQEHKTAGGADA